MKTLHGFLSSNTRPGKALDLEPGFGNPGVSACGPRAWGRPHGRRLGDALCKMFSVIPTGCHRTFASQSLRVQGGLDDTFAGPCESVRERGHSLTYLHKQTPNPNPSGEFPVGTGGLRGWSRPSQTSWPLSPSPFCAINAGNSGLFLTDITSLWL